MKKTSKLINTGRRDFLRVASAITAATATGLLVPQHIYASATQIRKAIPKSGEMLPVIGMGTSRTFDTDDSEVLTRLQQVTQTFFDMGGGMIDSSPMYGTAQQVIGQLLPKVKGNKNLFSATKVWTDGRQEGIDQMERSRKLWGINQFDLMQIHNLVDWETHLETLQQMKVDKKLRYIGITTSHGRFHAELSDILAKQDIDFVQLTYNIANHEVEDPLLSIAQDKGIAVIVNRPYQRGSLFRHVKGKALPAWAQEFDCHSWGQYFLKYVVSHPAITCAIPATSKVKHMKDNMQAGLGRLPTAKQRVKMLKHFKSL